MGAMIGLRGVVVLRLVAREGMQVDISCRPCA